jgi:excisionase family DNA binding protein
VIDLAELPPALDAEQAAELLGCSRSHLWALVRTDRCPVPVLRLGRMMRFPRDPLLRALGLERDDAPPDQMGSASSIRPSTSAASPSGGDRGGG